MHHEHVQKSTFNVHSALLATSFAGVMMFVAACGGQDATTAGGSGETSSSGEGVVVYYSGRSETGLDAFEAAFEEAHPEIDLQVIKGGNDDLTARLLTEASRQQADVTELGAAYMAQVHEAGILGPVEDDIVAGLPEQAAGPDNLYVGTRYSAHVIPYNTDTVPAERIPQTHEDFLDPYWQEKFVIATGDVEWAFKEYMTRGEEGARTFFRDIMAQEPLVLDQGRGSIAELIASGQAVAATTTQVHNLEPRKAKNLPIDGTPFDPPVILVDYIATFADAPHPEATKVFLSWLFSEEGFETDAELGQSRIGDEDSVALLEDPDTIVMDPTNLDEQAAASEMFREEILGR